MAQKHEVKPPKDLKACVGKWRKALVDADTGPLVIAKEVVEISDEWELYRDVAGKKTASAFLRRELGRGRDLAFFRRRARAVERLGEEIRRVLHHEVAVWVDQNFEGDEARRAVWVLMKETKTKNHGNAFSIDQARRIVLAALDRKTEHQPKTCPRCEVLAEENRVLREELERAGIKTD